MFRESSQAVDLYFWIVLDERLPVLFRRIVNRGNNHAEILRVLVRSYVKLTIVVIDVIFMTVFPRENDLESSSRIICRKITKLPRRLSKGTHKEHFLIERTSRAHVKQFILFLVEQLILIASDNMPPEFIRPLRDRVFGCIKERLVVVGPIYRANSLDAFAQRFSCA